MQKQKNKSSNVEIFSNFKLQNISNKKEGKLNRFSGVLFSLIKPISKTDNKLIGIGEKEKNELIMDVESSALPLKSPENDYEERELFKSNEMEKKDSIKKRAL